MKQSGFLKEGALETLEKSLGPADINNSGLEDSFETPRESRRQTFLGRDRFKSLIPRLRTSSKARDDTENEIESDVTSEGVTGPDITGADSEMLEKMFEELLMSESQTTEAAPLSPAVLSGSRPRRLRKPSSLFSTEERRKSSILSRARSRVRLS